MLKGKNAIITGASRGIGREIAIELAKCGCNIVFNYRSNDELAYNLASLIKEYGVECEFLKGNVANLNDADNLIKLCKEKFKTVDILVNNAGITRDNLIIRMKEEEFNEVIETNLKGTFNTIKSVSSIMMKQRSGRIINISSVVGVSGNVGQCNYSASKAGVLGITKSIAKELGGRGVTVNAVAPGFIETDMTNILNDKVKENIINSIPLKKFGKPEDIAKLVSFLSSDEASYITGQTIHVDGGMIM